MSNVIKFGPMLQAIILNPKLLEQIKKEEVEAKKWEAKMDAKIKKEKNGNEQRKVD